MRSLLTFLMLMLFVCASMLIVPGCATEEDYPVVVGDSTDGPDEVTISQEDWEGHKDWTIEDAARQNCKNLNQFHFSAHSACYQTYNNYVWKQNADIFCDDYVDGMTASCYDEFSSWMFWSYSTSYPQGQSPWYGDYFRWTCAGGWPYLTTPNDSGALATAFYACDPNYAKFDTFE